MKKLVSTQKAKSKLFAYIRKKSHEASALHRICYGALERRTASRTLAGEHFALAGAHFLQGEYIFVINKCRAGTALFGAKTTAVFLSCGTLFADH
jgi:hypothetical protein